MMIDLGFLEEIDFLIKEIERGNFSDIIKERFRYVVKDKLLDIELKWKKEHYRDFSNKKSKCYITYITRHSSSFCISSKSISSFLFSDRIAVLKAIKHDHLYPDGIPISTKLSEGESYSPEEMMVIAYLVETHPVDQYLKELIFICFGWRRTTKNRWIDFEGKKNSTIFYPFGDGLAEKHLPSGWDLIFEIEGGIEFASASLNGGDICFNSKSETTNASKTAVVIRAMAKTKMDQIASEKSKNEGISPDLLKDSSEKMAEHYKERDYSKKIKDQKPSIGVVKKDDAVPEKEKTTVKINEFAEFDYRLIYECRILQDEKRAKKRQIIDLTNRINEIDQEVLREITATDSDIKKSSLIVSVHSCFAQGIDNHIYVYGQSNCLFCNRLSDG